MKQRSEMPKVEMINLGTETTPKSRNPEEKHEIFENVVDSVQFISLSQDKNRIP